MKKRLEAELISIAHRVLKLKNKSEIDQLYHETQKLYEALTVLKFYGDNYEQVKSDISNEDIEEKIESFVENKTVVATPKVVVEEIATEVEEQKEEIVAEVEEVVEQEIVAASEETEVQEEDVEEEPVIVGEITLEEEDEIEEEEVPVGEAKSDLDFEPIFELAAETPVETEEIEEPKVEEDESLNQVQTKAQQISFEDLLGQNYTEPVFVKPNDVTLPTSKKEVFEKSDDIIVDRFEGKTPSLNDKLSKTINIGLNDRMGFVKFLFADSNEDYNRVLSQLNTFSTFREAKDFIDEIIKPDYNNWVGADDYADRFIELVEKKFL